MGGGSVLLHTGGEGGGVQYCYILGGREGGFSTATYWGGGRGGSVLLHTGGEGGGVQYCYMLIDQLM